MRAKGERGQSGEERKGKHGRVAGEERAAVTGKVRERNGGNGERHTALDVWCSDGTPKEPCWEVRAHTTPPGEGRVITRVQGYLLTRLHPVQSTRATHRRDRQTEERAKEREGNTDKSTHTQKEGGTVIPVRNQGETS